MKIRKTLLQITPLVLTVASITLAITGCELNCPTKFVMHRGLSSRFFENTESAFIGAGKKHGTWGIETDIYLTSDNHLVCAHDINPFRVNNGSNISRDAGWIDSSLVRPGEPNPTTGYWDPHTGTKITDLTLAQAQTKKLWTGYTYKNSNGNYEVIRDDTNCYGIGGDQYIPSFIQYLRICKKYNKEAIIEIKDENALIAGHIDEVIDELINEINDVNYAKHCTVIAFDDYAFDRSEPFYKAIIGATQSNNNSIAKTAKKLLSKFQKLCWEDINHPNVLADAYESLQKGISVDVDANYVTSDLVRFAHEKKLIVNTWTVNEESVKKHLIELGVDQITGNVAF